MTAGTPAPDVPKPYPNRKQAEAALARLAHLATLLEMQAALRQEDVRLAQVKHESAIRETENEISTIRERIEAWAVANREKEFAGEKTLELAAGWLRFRTGPRALGLLDGWTWPLVLKKLLGFPKTNTWRKYVREKFEINKQQLLADTNGPVPALPEAQLKKVGLAIEQGETFSLEARPEPAAGAA